MKPRPLKAALLAGLTVQYAGAQDLVSPLTELKAEVTVASAAAPKPVIRRLDSMDVYSLAPSAYLLQSGHLLSAELYAEIKSGEDIARFRPFIREAALKYALPEALLYAIIMTESGFDPRASSSAGARGLMQLMPETLIDLKVADPYDEEANINAGAAYFKAQLRRFKRLDVALAAYNAGPANVVKYGGIPPFSETVHFIEKVRAYYEKYAALAAGEQLP